MIPDIGRAAGEFLIEFTKKALDETSRKSPLLKLRTGIGSKSSCPMGRCYHNVTDKFDSVGKR